MPELAGVAVGVQRDSPSASGRKRQAEALSAYRSWA
jgi:hypothetical protein